VTDTVLPVPLNIASPDCAGEFFAGRAARCLTLRHAASLAELREVLDHCLDDPARPITLDLIGHGTRGHRLLRLGQTPIDMLNPHVAGFFATLARDQLLTRLHVTAVRLLGCETAVTDAGQRTLRMLSHALRLPVFGTTKPLFKSHSNSAGFDPAFAHILIEAAALTGTRQPRPEPAWPGGASAAVVPANMNPARQGDPAA
jgi:hypothetical protein